MHTWLVFDGPPTVGFFRGWLPDAVSLPDIRHAALSEVGKLTRTLNASGETSNLPVSFDNTQGDVLPVLEKLVNSKVSVKTYIDSQVKTVFAGTMAEPPRGDQRLSANIVGANLIAPLPLRSTTELEEFSEVLPIPRAFGSAIRLRPIRLSSDAREWLIIGAAASRIISVTDDIGELPTSSYALSNRITGEISAAVLLLADPPNGELSVVFDGERDQLDGAIIDNPADALYYVLTELAGQAFDRNLLDRLRLDMIDTKVRGVFNFVNQSAHTVARELITSAGAVWSDGSPEMARRWPPVRGANDPIRGELTKLSGWDVVSSQQPRHTIFTVNYDFDWSIGNAGDYRRAIILEAPVLRRQLGDLPLTINLKYIGEASMAEDIALRLCPWLASERYTVTWTAGREAALNPPGSWYELNHPHSRLIGEHILIEASPDLQTGTTDLTAEGYVGALPVVEIIQRSLRNTLQADRLSGNAVGVTEQEVIATDANGEPIPGATVEINGQIYTADNAGRVFVAGLSRGETYTITITAADGRTNTTVLQVS